MKRVVGLVLVAVVLIPAGGCGGPDGLMKDMVSQVNDLAASIEKKEPADKQKAIAEKIKATTEKIEKLNLSKEEKERLQKKYEPEMKAAAERLLKAVAANPEAMGNLAGVSMPGPKGE